jgi:hypothetical protein
MNTQNQSANGVSKSGSGRFQPGRSGNPRGKLPGTRNRTTLLAETLLDGEAEALTRKAIELALNGDSAALRLCIERLIPIRRDRTVTFPLPPLKTAADAAQALSAIILAVAKGSLTPSEANEISKSVTAFAAAFETQELAKRVEMLERAQSNSDDEDEDVGLSEYDQDHAEIRRMAKEAKAEFDDVA